jgi:mannitol 2-dehydrogenase
LTLTAAAWFRYNLGVRDSGEAFKVDDPMLEELQEYNSKGPLNTLEIRKLFGDDLRKDERFIKELKTALAGLEKEGAMKMIEKYA